MTARRAVVAVGLLCAALCVTPQGLAQLPRPSTGYLTQKAIRDWAHTGSFTRVITVDSGGKGDYSDLSDGLAAAAAVTPRDAYHWVSVLVYPGNTVSGDSPFGSYLKTSITIPDFVNVRGVSPAGTTAAGPWNGNVVVLLTGASGTLASVGESVVSDLDLVAIGTATGNMVVVGKTSGSGFASLNNVNVVAAAPVGDAHNVDLVSVSGGGPMYLTDVGLWGFTEGTKLRMLVTSVGASVYRGRISGAENQPVLIETTGSAHVKLFSARIDEGATCDLKPASAGSIEAYSTEYHSTCGTGTVANATSFLEALAAPPSGTCAPGATGYDATHFYLCVAGTWRRIAHAAMS